MENESRLKLFLQKILDSLNDQVWFQELKTKWEELDPQSRHYVKLGGMTGLGVLFLFLVISSMISVYSSRGEWEQKHEILRLVRQVNDEMRSSPRIQKGGPEEGESTRITVNWNQAIEAAAISSGIPIGTVKIEENKNPAKDVAVQERFYSVDLSQANIRQVVKFAYQLEHGQQPIKVRRLMVSTVDAQGALSAKMHLSAFEFGEFSQDPAGKKGSGS